MESDIIISTREQHTESEEIKMTDYSKIFGDGGLRYFLEQQIIASEINKNKEHNK